MFIVYDLIFFLIALVYLPVYLLRRKFHRGFLLRLGFLPKDLALDRPIWLHVVSVGEAITSRQFLEELRLAFPHKKFVISTVTPTGNKIARAIAKEGDFVTYLTLDISFIVSKVVKRINPSLFIAVETEIWPNLIHCLHKKHVPFAVINGRISDRSFKGYAILKFLIKPVLDKVGLFCVQTARDAQRLSSLGVAKNKIEVTGNMKFDFKAQALKFDNPGLCLKYQEQLLVCGSTHPGEEKIILAAYRDLLAEFSDLRLLIAPRHPERADEVENIIIKSGFNSIRVSQLAGSPATAEWRGAAKGGISQLNPQTRTLPAGRQEPANPQTVFILDTVGQLLTFYSIADIVFVGGSLSKTGGHNILEPAALGKPVIFGPHMFNFRDIADLFLNNQAALLIHNQEELKAGIAELLRNPGRIPGLIRSAKKLILDNQGATGRNLERVREFYLNAA